MNSALLEPPLNGTDFEISLRVPVLLPSACPTSSRVAVSGHGFPSFSVCCILFSQPLLCQVFLHPIHSSPSRSSSSSPSFYLHLESSPSHMVLLPSKYIAIPPQPLLLDLSAHLCDLHSLPDHSVLDMVKPGVPTRPPQHLHLCHIHPLFLGLLDVPCFCSVGHGWSNCHLENFLLPS